MKISKRIEKKLDAAVIYGSNTILIETENNQTVGPNIYGSETLTLDYEQY
ncbi:MAG: hypothetical protein U9R21_01100 [Candidatus Thermoplasmatota archaeon]|nr:hypothetical protein [Candidatus Thermoplasmatota archaeon]